MAATALGAAIIDPQQREGLIGVEVFHIIDGTTRRPSPNPMEASGRWRRPAWAGTSDHWRNRRCRRCLLESCRAPPLPDPNTRRRRQQRRRSQTRAARKDERGGATWEGGSYLENPPERQALHIVRSRRRFSLASTAAPNSRAYCAALANESSDAQKANDDRRDIGRIQECAGNARQGNAALRSRRV